MLDLFDRLSGVSNGKHNGHIQQHNTRKTAS
jgi:hypothetical protein